jgi:Protein of unknown function (DUF3515)
VAIGIVALGRGSGSDSTTDPTAGALPALTPVAPPQAAAQAAPCAKVLAELPVQLGTLDPRVVHTKPDSPYVVGWGDPAVVLRCGVDRPKALVPGSSAEFINGGDVAGPYFDVTRGADGNVYTTVDRAPYISITVPTKYQGGTVLPPLSEAIAKALPAVCSTDPNEPDPDKLCTRRK